MTGDSRRAIGMLDEALALARHHDSGALECRVLISLGALASETSRTDDARSHYEAALELARAASDVRREGLLQGNLGVLHHQLGRLDEAAPCYERAVKLAMVTGDKPSEGNQRCNLGLLRFEQCRLTEARAELMLASCIAAAIGHVRLQGVTQCNLGLALEAERLPLMALAAYEAALATAGADRRAEGQYRIYVGRTLRRVGRLDEARACLDRASAVLDEDIGPWTLCLLHCALAELAASDETLERAQQILGRAEALLVLANAGTDSEPARETACARATLRAARGEAVSRG
jgi:tetratricopeptide (TPR) repeat protein